MALNTEQKNHTIDATDKILGRLAAEIAVILRGKNRPDFVPYKIMGDVVIVKNVEKMKFTGKKTEQKKYYRHSGYLGSLKSVVLKEAMAKKPSEVLRDAVSGMLPKNRLRSKLIKRLKFAQ